MTQQGQQQGFSHPGGEPRVIGAVLSRRDAPFSAFELSGALRREWGLDLQLTGPPKVLEATVDGMPVKISQVARPMEPQHWTPTVANNTAWPGGPAACDQHTMQVVIDIKEVRDPWEGHRLFTKLAASILGIQGAIGIYLSRQQVTYSAEQYRTFAEGLARGEDPVQCWVHVTSEWIQQGGTSTAWTYGLRPFGHEEIEVDDAFTDPDTLWHFVDAVVRSVLGQRQALMPGQAFTVNDDQNVEITHGPGRHVTGTALKLAVPDALVDQTGAHAAAQAEGHDEVEADHEPDAGLHEPAPSAEASEGAAPGIQDGKGQSPMQHEQPDHDGQVEQAAPVEADHGHQGRPDAPLGEGHDGQSVPDDSAFRGNDDRDGGMSTGQPQDAGMSGAQPSHDPAEQGPHGHDSSGVPGAGAAAGAAAGGAMAGGAAALAHGRQEAAHGHGPSEQDFDVREHQGDDQPFAQQSEGHGSLHENPDSHDDLESTQHWPGPEQHAAEQQGGPQSGGEFGQPEQRHDDQQPQQHGDQQHGAQGGVDVEGINRGTEGMSVLPAVFGQAGGDRKFAATQPSHYLEDGSLAPEQFACAAVLFTSQDGDAEQVIQNFGPGTQMQAQPQRDPSGAVFLGGEHNGLAWSVQIVPEPLPMEPVEEAVRTNVFWPEGVDAVRQQRSRAEILVRPTGGSAEAVDLHALLGLLVHRVLSTPNPIGVHLPHMHTLLQDETYVRQNMSLIDSGEPAPLNWVYCLAGERPQGGVHAFTWGLRAFGHEELEVIEEDPNVRPGDVYGYLLGVAEWVLRESRTIDEGGQVQVGPRSTASVELSDGVALSGRSLKLRPV